ncbi:transporter substrate-binding domain-containing protein [Oceanispirochaeta sp.]|uniref:transporter substrate-binding domain-containing protein n=1 Tax=Oceanispirochaeta sp. TaxID=2035350 RepID=UPI002602EEC7|nr:transporter substrate-binding domain-containing protein [Oceanispirochaeta sp.]MDA3958589.1 transporter substrate-binding domain-containing protein [Oceanispirochaeta sp.]
MNTSSAFGEFETGTSLLTEAERVWIKAHPVIRLAPDPEFQPVEFFDKDGNYAGIGADYAELIAEKLGISFEIVECKNWDDVIDKMKRREVDVLNAVVKSSAREVYMDFPPPYLTIPSVIIVRKNVTEELTLEKLKGLHVIMVSGYGYVDLIRIKYPEIKIELVPDLKSALRKVSFSMADAFVGDLATASFYIESEGITNLKVAGETEPPNVSGFGVRSDWPELSSILEKGVTLLSENERKNIRQKWIHLETAEGVTKRELQSLILITIAGIFLIVLVFTFWNLMLNRVVKLRTKDLLKEVEDRKRAELALKESERNFRALADTSPLAIYMSEGVEQKCVYINSTFTNLFGYTIDDVPTADHWYPLAYPDAEYRRGLVDEWQKRIELAIKTGSDIEPMEAVVKCKDGSKKHISWGFITMGEQNWACGLDLTERLQAEEKRAALESQLSQSQKMEAIGTLAGGVAHDFNNILAAMLGYADLALLDLPKESIVKNQIEQIIKAGYRARDLVKQILSFSRKEFSQRRSLDVYTVVKEALILLRASIPSTIRIEEDLDSQCGNILADPTQIHQVMMNLCTNAAQAMDENGGTLKVTLNSILLTKRDVEDDPYLKPGNFVLLIIEDSGTGIEKQYIDRIFDPYFTTKDIGKGSGMGLAVVAGIIKSNDAFISVDTRPGTGTTIKVYFPRIQTQNFENIKIPDPLPLGQEKILIVDDEKSVVEITKQCVEKLGYEATGKTSSREALELFQSRPNSFDLIITDQTMPDLTGENLAIEIMKIRPDIPVILCTGFSTKMNQEKAKMIGIRGFLMKPFNMKELSITIRKILDQGPSPTDRGE